MIQLHEGATYTRTVCRVTLMCSVSRMSSEFIVGCIDGPEHCQIQQLASIHFCVYNTVLSQCLPFHRGSLTALLLMAFFLSICWSVIFMIWAGLTIVPVVPWEGAARRQGAPDQLPNFYHAVLTFERSV